MLAIKWSRREKKFHGINAVERAGQNQRSWTGTRPGRWWVKVKGGTGEHREEMKVIPSEAPGLAVGSSREYGNVSPL